MSAFHGFRHPDRIQILSDAAVTDENGVVVALLPKCMIIQEELPAVICLRYADQSAAVAISEWFGAVQVATVDDLLLRTDEFAQEFSRQAVPACDFLLGALSETKGPVMLAFTNHNGWQNGDIPPFTLTLIQRPNFGAGPCGAAQDTTLLLRPDDPEFPRQCGAEYFELMRRVPQTFGGRPGFTSVAGSIW